MATRSTQPSLIFAGTKLICILKNMNWMPLDGMPVLTNNFLLFYALLPCSHWWVICRSFEFPTSGFATGCIPCSHPCLSQEAGCCQWCGWWVCWWEGGARPQGCSWVRLLLLSVASRGEEETYGYSTKKLLTEFRGVLTPDLTPSPPWKSTCSQPGFSGCTTWGPIWNVYQDYRASLETCDS